MRTTKQMSVTLPHKMADMVRAKVVSGESVSESETGAVDRTRERRTRRGQGPTA